MGFVLLINKDYVALICVPLCCVVTAGLIHLELEKRLDRFEPEGRLANVAAMLLLYWMRKEEINN